MVIAIGGEMHFASVLRKTKMVDTGGFVDVDRATGMFALRLDTHFYVATNTFAQLPIHPILGRKVHYIVHFTFILKVRDLKR